MDRPNFTHNIEPVNPFPATAVARLLDAELPGVETAAVKQARAFLDDYMARSNAEVDRGDQATGSTIAIVGEYGTGKTHIALGMLHRLASTGDDALHSFYLDAPADTFVALYRDRFIPRLKRREVRRRVEEYLLDVVADHLRASAMTSPAADQLRTSEARPLEVIKDLGLMETDLLRQLRLRLRGVSAEQDVYAIAMSLLLRPEFEDAVWEWLKGNPPDPALKERGILVPIDSEAAALEAIGVLAFLFGRRGHRFVLIIDEMEKVLTSQNRGALDESTVLAFKKLMETLSQSRALLVLVGLPDFLETLPSDARQRIATVIRPTPLGVEEITQYIHDANCRAFGSKSLKPFTRDAVSYIAELTGGNARRVVRLCYYAYVAAYDAGGGVTRALLREVARSQFEESTQEDAGIEITRIIDSNGWRFARNKLGADNVSKADFWLPVGEAGSGCVVLLCRSVLHAEDADKLVALVAQLSDQGSGEVNILSLLVVNGYLAKNLASRIDEAFDRVIVFKRRRFAEDFEAAAKGLIQRLEEATRQNILVYLRERVDQLSRQSGYLVDQTEELLRTIPNFATLDSAVANGIRDVFAQAAGAAAFGPIRGYSNVAEVLSRTDDLANQLESIIAEGLGMLPETGPLISRRVTDPLKSSVGPIGELLNSLGPVVLGLRVMRRQVQRILSLIPSRLVDPSDADYLVPFLHAYTRIFGEWVDERRASGLFPSKAQQRLLTSLLKEAAGLPDNLASALRADLEPRKRPRY